MIEDEYIRLLNLRKNLLDALEDEEMLRSTKIDEEIDNTREILESVYKSKLLEFLNNIKEYNIIYNDGDFIKLYYASDDIKVIRTIYDEISLGILKLENAKIIEKAELEDYIYDNMDDIINKKINKLGKKEL